MLGTSPIRSIVAALIPVTIFTLIGVDNSLGANRHFFGFLTVLTVLLYCVSEESGWRGYLQDALHPLPTAAWTGIIGGLW